jgi:uncharacterized repeat protein (TIGR03806 family)
MISLLLSGCAAGVTFDVDAPPERLSSTRLIRWEGDAGPSYGADVVPYEVNTPLFSNHAAKDRAMWLPPGEAATYDPVAAFDLPDGTILLKSFSFPADLREPDVDRRLIETRLLVRGPAGWVGFPYIWDDAGRDAVLSVAGGRTDVSIINEEGTPLDFTYVVPQKNQCVDCHELTGDDDEGYTTPIGVKARHLHRSVGGTDQLADLADRGLLVGLPPADEVPAATDWASLSLDDLASWSDAKVEAVTRDYLDMNCAHCHNRAGTEGVTSQLFLDPYEQDPFHLGVCKRPGSAGKGGVGRTFDIVPGDHEASIFWYRMQTEDLGSMMPDIGRELVHTQGVRLVEAWIDRMEGSCSE